MARTSASRKYRTRSGTSSTTTHSWGASTSAPRQSLERRPSAESVSYVPGRSVSDVPGCSLARRLISTCQELDLRQQPVEVGAAVELAIGHDGTDLLGV